MKKTLEDLLCIIHRDGGHYIDKHGIQKAYEDALEIHYRQRDAEKHLSTTTQQLIAELDCILNNASDFTVKELLAQMTDWRKRLASNESVEICPFCKHELPFGNIGSSRLCWQCGESWLTEEQSKQ